MSLFKKAEKKSSFLRVALTGPSGSGKTFSALRLAKGLGGKIAVLDTENGSASLYSDKFDFDVVELTPPFSADRYINIIEEAQKAGYNVLMIDSLSHVWAGEGGVIDKKESLDERGGNQWTNWRKPKAEHQKLKDAILFSNIHIISTIRSKQAYAQKEEGNNKKSIQKLGMDPIAEPGVEYEYTTVFDVGMDHKAMASKDRTSIFGEQIFTITEETGKQFISWLGGEPILRKTGGDYIIEGGRVHKDKSVRQVVAELGPEQFKKDLVLLRESNQGSQPWAMFLLVNGERYLAELADVPGFVHDEKDWTKDDFDSPPVQS